MNIHSFSLNGMHILLDVNSGAVHVVDEMISDIMNVFDGGNDEEVLASLAEQYSEDELREALAELHELIAAEKLFTPALEVPPTFKAEPILKSLCLHVAHDCNLRCRYCFAGTGDFGHSRGLMSAEVGKKAIDFLLEKSGSRRHLEIDFFGGEPLMNFEVVKELTAYVRRREQEAGKEVKLTLTTNAVLLRDEELRFLNEEGISLVLSLDGRKEVHDYMRPNAGGNGSYETVMSNIDKAIRSRNDQNYYLRGTFTAHNLDFAADVLDMADRGYTQLSVEPVVAEDEAEYALKEEHLPELFRQYELLAKEYLERKMRGEGFDFFHFNVDIENGPCVAKRLSGCGAGHEYLAVTPQGEFYPCHQFVGREAYRLGSVEQGIVNEELPWKFRRAHVLAKEECSQCWARFYCSGGCHANADAFHGCLEKPYELGCKLQKKRLECALMVQAALALAKRQDS